MRKETRPRGAAPLLLLALLLSLAPAPTRARDAAPVSRPGDYSGYSRPLYTGWARTSQYIAARDGTRLAADIFRPAVAGRAVEEPLPVIWMFDRYQRASNRDGRLVTQLDQDSWLSTVLSHGYVIGVVDVRGGGASFGTWPGPFTQLEAQDGYDVTEWFAAQPWCNKRVGMYGRSYSGITQYLTAALAPPHLKAIFPEMALFDLYSFLYPGGVYRQDFVAHWDQLVHRLDQVTPAAPVDEDAGGALLAQAVEGHRRNASVRALSEALPLRDAADGKTGRQPYVKQSPSSYAERVRKSKVAVYHLGGWYDMWTRDTLLWFRNLDNPQKVVIGPWPHQATYGFNLGAEHLRWYDYHLKGIDNKVMEEPPIHYYTMGAPPGREWRSAWRWPLPEERPTPFYFRAGAGAPGAHLLSPEAPVDAEAADAYTVDYSATSGKSSRWANGYGGQFGYLNMAPNDAKGLTYTTAPLAADTEVTGHPVVHLWVKSASRDADFFVYLEEVLPNGDSRYVTEGALRGAHRATAPAPYDNLGLPYHRGYAADIAPLPPEPVELVFDLHPTSNLFRAGNSIRVTVTGADKDNAATAAAEPPPSFSVLRDGGHASHIVLPLVPQTAGAGAPAAAAAAPAEDAPAPRAYGPYVWLLAAILLSSLAVSLVLIARRRRGRRRSRV